MVNDPVFVPVIGVPGWTWSRCRKSMFQVNALAGNVAPVLSVPLPLKPMTSPALKKVPSVGDRIVAVGGVPTTMVSGGDGVLLTPSETVSRAVYWPAVA